MNGVNKYTPIYTISSFSPSSSDLFICHLLTDAVSASGNIVNVE